MTGAIARFAATAFFVLACNCNSAYAWDCTFSSYDSFTNRLRELDFPEVLLDAFRGYNSELRAERCFLEFHPDDKNYSHIYSWRPIDDDKGLIFSFKSFEFSTADQRTEFLIKSRRFDENLNRAARSHGDPESEVRYYAEPYGTKAFRVERGIQFVIAE